MSSSAHSRELSEAFTKQTKVYKRVHLYEGEFSAEAPPLKGCHIGRDGLVRTPPARQMGDLSVGKYN